MNDDLDEDIERLRTWMGERLFMNVPCPVPALHRVLDALTDAEADAQRLAERVRSVRLMFETAGMHRTAEEGMNTALTNLARAAERRALR